MVHGRRVLSAGSWLAIALALAPSCKGDTQGNAPPIGGTQPTSGADDDDDDSMTGVDSADSTATGGDGNCGDMMCTGHSACMDVDGVQTCVCDHGYDYEASSGECIVDETCIEVRYLEDHCRQLYDGPPAVSLFFAVDFCAGTAMLPEDKERLGLEFQVLEDGVDIAENVESYSKVIDQGVDSYVTLVVDVSGSVTDDPEQVGALVEELRDFVEGLAPGPDDPDLYVSIDVFARDHGEYLRFTRDLAAVDAALAVIASDPASLAPWAGNEDGTDLYDAVAFGIERTQRARDLRDAVTWGGVLTTGTVVVVTDAKDESGAMLETALIDKTTNQVISVGISNKIEDEDLQEIGRDGSFLAPTTAELTAAFAEIRQRVDEYPRRSYFLAYCSSRTEGAPVVEVKVVGADVESSSAGCAFTPSAFSIDPADVCTPEFFETECDVYECGGITACGPCADDECCDGASCISPVSANDLDLPCDAQNDLCYVDGQVCTDAEGAMCQAAAGIGDPCGDDSPCVPGVGYCDEKEAVCMETLDLGEPCGDTPEKCASLHCDRTNPDMGLDPKVCQAGAEIYDSCGNAYGTCEVGSYCKGTECAPRLHDFESCANGEECRHAQCIEVGARGKICGGPAACFWAWDQKFPN
jgi:hypothetical protein